MLSLVPCVGDGGVFGFCASDVVASWLTSNKVVITRSMYRRLVFISLRGEAGSSALAGFGMTSSFNTLEFEVSIFNRCSCGGAEQVSVGDIEYLCAEPLIGGVATA